MRHRGGYVHCNDNCSGFKCTSCPELRVHLSLLHARKLLTLQIADLRDKLSDSRLRLLPEYRSRVEVLKQLNYLDQDEVIQLKGRVACEITTCDELIGTELVFSNTLTKMEPEEIVALLSALIFEQKNASAPMLSKPLEVCRCTFDLASFEHIRLGWLRFEMWPPCWPRRSSSAACESRRKSTLLSFGRDWWRLCTSGHVARRLPTLPRSWTCWRARLYGALCGSTRPAATFATPRM